MNDLKKVNKYVCWKLTQTFKDTSKFIFHDLGVIVFTMTLTDLRTLTHLVIAKFQYEI